MAWKVIAGVRLEQSEDPIPLSRDFGEIEEFEFGVYPDKTLAQWWAINGKNVWIDAAKEFLVKTPLIVYMRIEEEIP